MPKKRADQLLVERGLAESRARAQRLVMAGQVRAAGQVVPKPATMLEVDTALEVQAGPRYVSRGGFKLEAAFDGFELDVEGLICADVGASTGGFTDCLLQHGAAKVYAIDVGRGQLHWKLRQDARVVVMEQTNARHLEALPELVDFVTVDASFISLKVLLPLIAGWLKPHGRVVALVKPQFEAGREEASRGKGVIRDAEVHRRVLLDVLGFSEENGFRVQGLVASPVRGPKGNVEFLALFSSSAEADKNIKNLVEMALAAVEEDD